MHVRRISWGILALALLLTRLAHAQTRTVAVVYDDSGSMGNAQDPAAPWRYANYALQTLTALLAPGDALTVVRMSSYSAPVALDLGNPAAEIAAIRGTRHAGGGTPYDAVQNAMQVLAQAAQREASSGVEASEKWLIIITDGQFVDRPLTADEVNGLTGDIREFVERTGARTLLLMIGDVDQQVLRLWEQEAQARRYEASDRGQIAERMRQMAADITQRSTQPLPVQVRGSTATLATELPLRRVTVLQQREQAPMLAALQRARSAGEELAVPPPLEPAMPAGSSAPVFARIHHVTGARTDAVIPEGNVALDFVQELDPQHLQLLPEVAARLAVWMADEQGRPLAGAGTVYEVCEGSAVRVRATLVSPGGDTLLRLVRRPDRFRMEMTYGTQTLPFTAAAGGAFFERGLTPPAQGAAAVSVSASYPGYFHFRSRIFTVRAVECPPRTLSFLPVPEWRAKVTELHRAPPVVLVPRVDGQPVEPEELDQWSFTREAAERLKVDVRRVPAGWELRPRKTWGLACCTPTGDIAVEVEARSTNSREAPLRRTVVLHVEDVGFWGRCGWLIVLALLALLLAWYLIRIVRKRRFCPGSEIVYQRVGRAASRPFTHGLPGRNLLLRWLWPARAERRVVEGVVFEPGLRCSYIVLPAKAQTEDMYVAGEPIDDPGRRDVRIASGDALEIRKGGGRRETYMYSLRAG